MARDEATEHSDVDLAITTEPGVGLFALSDIRLYAKEQLGADVELAFLKNFHPTRLESASEDLISIF